MRGLCRSRVHDARCTNRPRDSPAIRDLPLCDAVQMFTVRSLRSCHEFWAGRALTAQGHARVPEILALWPKVNPWLCTKAAWHERRPQVKRKGEAQQFRKRLLTRPS